MNHRELLSTIEGDITLILTSLNRFNKEQDNNFAKLKEKSISDPTSVLRSSLQCLGRNVSQFVENPDSEKALKAITLLSVITAQPEAAGARLSMLASQDGLTKSTQLAALSISSAWDSFKKKIQSVIQSISSALWSLVSNYLNLKEWSVKGNGSIPAIASLFGITGSMEIQFTFEK